MSTARITHVPDEVFQYCLCKLADDMDTIGIESVTSQDLREICMVLDINNVEEETK